ncbi:XPG N-terminal domain-containing protein [Cardiosporidium cionae]|uniref:XPG N-terminal domain-containing protein n=1 Tax=Cardiosporidium cionae TaxID=476202 RepID=A0ABQ7JGB9_9APIC|nr:XPG N-terminal domain-containing protein [Cardiosporidium cionae]|eukprot:KAF8822914.1 XPG N-terminal domain-containing protein [Cardiosporidium cionae]
MGVYGLWDIVAPAGRRISPEILSGRKLVVDASIWLVQFLKAGKNTSGQPFRNSYLVGFFWRICRLLYYRIYPIIVFDGAPPELKRRTLLKRRSKREQDEFSLRKTAQHLLLNAYKQSFVVNAKQALHKRSKAISPTIPRTEIAECNREAESNIATTAGSESSSLTLEKEASKRKFRNNYAAEIPDLSLDTGEEQAYDSHAIENQQPLEETRNAIPPSSSVVDAALKDLFNDSEDDEAHDNAEIESDRRRLYYENIPEEFRGFLSERRRLDDITLPESILRMPLAGNSKKHLGKSAASGKQLSMVPLNVFRDAEDFKGRIACFLIKKILTQLRDAWLNDCRMKALQSKEHLSVFSNVQIESYIRSIRTNQEIDKVKIAMAEEVTLQEKEFDPAQKNNGNQVYITAPVDVEENGPSAGPVYVPTTSRESNNSLEGTLSRNLPPQSSTMSMPSLRNETSVNADVYPYNSNRFSAQQSTRKKRGFANKLEFEPFAPMLCSKLKPRELLKPKELLESEPKFLNEQLMQSCDVANVEMIEFPYDIAEASLIKLDDEAIFGEEFLKPIKYSHEENTHITAEDKWSVLPHSSDEFISEAKVPMEDDEFKDCQCINSSVQVNFDRDTKPSPSYESVSPVELVKNASESISLIKWKIPFNDRDTKEISKPNRSMKDTAASHLPINKYQNDTPLAYENTKQKTEYNMKPCTNTMSETIAWDLVDIYKTSETDPALTQEAEDDLLSPYEEIDDDNNSVETPLKQRPSVQLMIELEKDAESSSDEIDEEAFTWWENICPVEAPDTQIPAAPFSPESPVCHFDSLAEINQSVLTSDKISNHAHSVSSKVASGTNCDNLESFSTIIEGNQDFSQNRRYEKIDTTQFDSKAMETGVMEDWDELQAQLEEENEILKEKFSDLQKNTDYITDEMEDEVRELLQAFGIPYVNAPAEAEAQCAVMNELNLCDGVISDDSDALVFGSNQVFRNFFESRKTVEMYESKAIERKLKLTKEDLILLAVLLGCDYTVGVKGVGAVNALEAIKAFSNLEQLREFRKWAESPWISATSEGESLYRKVYKEAHRSYRLHWEFPEDFPSEEVISAFMHPIVDHSSERFTWATPNLEEIVRIMTSKTSLTRQQVQETLKGLLARLSNREAGLRQSRIDEIFSFIPTASDDQVATIKSRRMLKALDTIQAGQSSVNTAKKSSSSVNSPAKERKNKRTVNVVSESRKKGKRMSTPIKKRTRSTQRTNALSSSPIAQSDTQILSPQLSTQVAASYATSNLALQDPLLQIQSEEGMTTLEDLELLNWDLITGSSESSLTR